VYPYFSGKRPLMKDNVTRQIKEAGKSTHDLMTDVGILSIGDDLADNDRINLLISSLEGRMMSACVVPSSRPMSYIRLEHSHV